MRYNLESVVYCAVQVFREQDFTMRSCDGMPAMHKIVDL